RVRQADADFAKDMQVFLARVQERSDSVLERSQSTYSTARISAIALLSVALLLAVLCWAFIRRGVLLPLQDAGRH
ncbi:methyl-accepting chemotaxis protein, partial [Achromobacter dolens]